ncbi:glycosyltransferase [Mycobacterium sp. ITM-2016-00317]|uniref:glycosyltransferase n=1 Tax=Mycobacterium sp. ITM-2016-00317 TaxID=2099694 RepID=UPI000D3FE7BB|nr:glycosyltransferase [Mycobacterium sp. ITM-2016-00317]WNG90326.1 glycosyltransferase [Mycobacterium sp. ITM-2016-00317]
MWHVHGSWTESFVAGDHHYLIPVNETRDQNGRGTAGRDWPSACEIDAAELSTADVDLVVLQRPHEVELAEHWLGRRPGIDVPAVYVEHNAPRPHPVDSVHPIAARTDIPLVHVTEFNRLMWDNGSAPTYVIDHGVADHGRLYQAEIPAAATMINEPVRRWRTVGADLLTPLSRYAPIDVWGMGTTDMNADVRVAERVTGRGDVSGHGVLQSVSRRCVYLHTARWTSLGLSLLEAMSAGMPVVAVAATMAPLAVPSDAGVVSADVTVLGEALEHFITNREAAEIAGKAAREFVLAHFGLTRFLGAWDRFIQEVC